MFAAINIKNIKFFENILCFLYFICMKNFFNRGKRVTGRQLNEVEFNPYC